MTDKKHMLVRAPEELVYRSCYAPVDLRQMMENAETRSRIRRLPASHLFFGLKELDDEERLQLLPYITQEQWTGVLDLDLWARDRMSVGQFLYWQKHIIEAADPVARKLIRAADPEEWELTFKRYVKIYPKVEDEVVGEPEEGEWMETPDGNYLVILPKGPAQARLIRALLLKVYQLEPGWAALLLESCRHRTSAEIEECAYQHRTRRIEELGFQDYYDAIEIYSHLPLNVPLPEKNWEKIREISLLPARLPRDSGGPLLIFQAFANLTRQQEIQPLVEELFYVCNRLLSADRISAADARRVKKGIRKAITGMNLGLDFWSGGDLNKATEGVRRYYLQSFFQLGFGRLMELQKEAQRLQATSQEPAAGTFLDAAFEALLEKYPRLAVQTKGTIQKRFFQSRRDLQIARSYLERIESPAPTEPLA